MKILKREIDWILVILISFSLIFLINFISKRISQKDESELEQKELISNILEKACIESNGITECFELDGSLYSIQIFKKEESRVSSNVLTIKKK